MTESNYEVHGGSYRDKFDEYAIELAYERGEIDHNDYIKIYKDAGRWNYLKNGGPKKALLRNELINRLKND